MANQKISSPWKGEDQGGGLLSANQTPTLTLPLLGGGKYKDRLRENADLSKTNWFRVGGKAQWLFKPEDANDLAAFLSQLPQEIPVTVLGVGSNIIVRDGGIGGVVVKLGRGFTGVKIVPRASCLVPGDEISRITNHEPRTTIHAGAACLDIHVAQFALDHSVTGLEFLSGIPGTVGGAVRMNAGAYDSDVSQVLIEAQVVLRDGTIKTFSNAELAFVYRNSGLPEGAIVTGAVFKTSPGDKDEIQKRMQDIATARGDTQPIRAQTGGSTFKNPDGHKAWELIEKSGCRGLTVGGAQVSEKHCNFLINTGSATAADLENLGEEVIRRVKEKTGIALEWEIKRIGKIA